MLPKTWEFSKFLDEISNGHRLPPIGTNHVLQHWYFHQNTLSTLKREVFVKKLKSHGSFTMLRITEHCYHSKCRIDLSPARVARRSV